MNIIEFVESPDLINDQTLSPAQKTVLKAVYRLPLTTGKELELFKQTTGLDEYRPREWSEAAFIIGRRGGKSDKIASNIALFEACSRRHRLSVGQVGVVQIVASEKKRQAKIVYDYILAKLERSLVLRRLIKSVTGECITLNNRIEIQVFPCDPGRLRGFSLVCFIGDEVASWMHEGKRVDRDILDSARPGLDFDYSKLIKISTPGMMKGEVWDDFKNYYGKPNDDVIVFRGSTELFNPAYSKRKLESMRKRKPGVYLVEHEAHFKKDVATMYDPERIDAAVNHNRPLELPYDKRENYFCFVDVAGGGGQDLYAIAIGHRKEERIIIDVVRSHRPKFNPDQLTSEYVALCGQYRIRKVCGDKFSGDWALNSWAKHSEGLIEYIKSDRTKSELYLNCEGLFNTEAIELPNKERALSELKDLIRKSRSGGKNRVDSYSGEAEDEANCICGVAANLAVVEQRPLSLSVLTASLGSEESKLDKLSEEDQDSVRLLRNNSWLLDPKEKSKERFERTVIEDESTD